MWPSRFSNRSASTRCAWHARGCAAVSHLLKRFLECVRIRRFCGKAGAVEHRSCPVDLVDLSCSTVPVGRCGPVSRSCPRRWLGRSLHFRHPGTAPTPTGAAARPIRRPWPRRMQRILTVQRYGTIGRRRLGRFACVRGNEMPTPPAAITEQIAKFLLIECFDECPHLCISAARIDCLVKTVTI